jgi:competence protein CoiA
MNIKMTLGETVMLCGIRFQDNLKVFASYSEKEHGPFNCPGCKHELVLRKGRIKVHHFAHKPPYHCQRGEGESDAHRKCKESIYNSLSKYTHVTNLDVEADFGAVIADVYCLINNVPVAIEIQRSNLSVNEITARTSAYEKLGINVLWLALFNKKLGEKKYSPKAWEKWCHATYYGRVYYWVADLTIAPVHFAEFQNYVESSSWYSESGEEQSAGGYYKYSKRYRTPSLGRFLNLATDFNPHYKKAWTSSTVYTPQCRVYLDKLKKWW